MAAIEGGPGIRVSDAERDRAATQLASFFAEGRLTDEEHAERLGELYAARTDIELARVFRELPAPVVVEGSGVRRRRAWRKICGLRWQLLPAAVTTVVWAMTGGGYFWPEWVYLGTAIGLVPQVRRTMHSHLPSHHLAMATEMAPGLSAPAMTWPNTSRGARRVLTVVFVDIVDSTGQVAAMGDAAWREMLHRFGDLVDVHLARSGGRRLSRKGDETAATFLSPAEGLGYAVALRNAAKAMGIELHIGIHSGELEGHAHDLSGIALHICQRVSALSGAGEILVTSTVRDLAQGSGFGFDDRGTHELRGLPEQWHLYGVKGRSFR
ncbi:MAG: adenylate/guanylate cyclase domain-containing protein [Acidimicrobiales bacterium]